MTSFINGGTPTYPGIIAESIPQLATLLRDLLIAEGWTLQSGDVGTYPMILSSQEIRNGVRVWLDFEASGTSWLMSGRIDGVAGNRSTQIITNQTAIGTGGRLWAVADGGRLAFWHRQGAQGLAVYGGFLSNPPDNDGYGWVIGHASSSSTSSTSTSHWAYAKRYSLVNNWYSSNSTTGFYANGLEPFNVPDNLIDDKTRIVGYFKTHNGDTYRGIADFFTPSLNGKAIASWHNIDGNVYVVTNQSAMLIDQVTTP